MHIISSRFILCRRDYVSWTIPVSYYIIIISFSFILIVNATRIPPGPGPGHALVVRCQRLAAVCEQAGRSRQKQVKGMQASKGKQRQAGRGRQEEKRERKNGQTVTTHNRRY